MRLISLPMISSAIFIKGLILFTVFSHVASQELSKWESQPSNHYKESTWLERNWRHLLLAVFTIILLLVLYIHVSRFRDTVVDTGLAVEMTARPVPTTEDTTPAITSMLESFPTLTFSSDEEVGRGDIMCPICHIDYTQGETIVSLPVCMHEFHLECIDSFWTFSGEARCPYCRHDYML